MNDENETTIRRGPDNVFADLGHTNPDTHLLEAQIVNEVHGVVRARKPTQTDSRG